MNNFHSAIEYLDSDVSQLIYETYMPTKEAKFNKKLLNDQIKYFCNPNIYPELFNGPDRYLCIYAFISDADKERLLEFNKIKSDLRVNVYILLNFLRKHYKIKIVNKKIIYKLYACSPLMDSPFIYEI